MIYTAEQKKIWREQTDAQIARILSTPNMQIPEGAAVYYVSNSGSDDNCGTSPEAAWATLTKVNETPMACASYVCFERGGLWRGQLVAQEGVTYTAYGEGDKPRLYRSAFNAADPALWEKTEAENVWALQPDWGDIGTLVFNEGEAHGIKCIIRTEEDGSTFNNTTGEVFNSYADLKTDLHFWHDYKNGGKVYLCSAENPGARFSSIELCSKGHNVLIKDGVNNVTVDNLCIKYTGSHGVGAGAGEHLTFLNLAVTNCEFGWIGGSIQAEAIFGRNYATRYGNAVEIWGGCDNFAVTDNYIYQVFDAAITQQYTERDDREVRQVGIVYSRNVIEYTNYSIEYWLKFVSESKVAKFGRLDGFVIEDNYMWYAGKGFCEQRPDKETAAHIKAWSGNCVTNNCVIRNNLMIETDYQFVHINPTMPNEDGSIAMPIFEGNTFAGRADNYFGIFNFGERELKGYTTPEECMGENTKGDTFWFEA